MTNPQNSDSGDRIEEDMAENPHKYVWVQKKPPTYMRLDDAEYIAERIKELSDE